jgi:phage I-like protein
MLPYLLESGEDKIRNREEIYMNLYQQLLVVHERLEGIGAHDDTMELVEKLLGKSEAARDDKTSITQVNVLRHMLKMREVIDNYNIYNDLQELISERDEVEVAAQEDASLAAYVDTERHPRPKSFYKAQKAQKEKAKKKN